VVAQLELRMNQDTDEIATVGMLQLLRDRHDANT